MKPEKLDMQSADGCQLNLDALYQIAPSCFTEAKDAEGKTRRVVNFDVLRQLLGDAAADTGEEFYQFTWPGKAEARREAARPIKKTLRPVKEDSVNWDTTENLYIEGDNLEVLKLLQKSYMGKVKMIYIDPPYNTGNDFVYNDDFSQSAEDYDLASGAVDELGARYRKNTDSNGRFHSDWCSMIYSRLQLARNLLKEDGVIFISIDDREICNLIKMCDDIFGNSNFISQFTWKSKLGKVGTTSTISAVHEYILCYAKESNSLSFQMIVKQSEGRKENLRQWGVADRREDRPSMWYPIIINGVTVYPYKEDGTEGRWRVGEEMAKELLASNSLILSNKDGKYNIYRIFPENKSISAYTTLLLDDIGTTAKGAVALKELGLNKIFDFSKPIDLVKHFIFLCKDREGLYLDFFSGSATTAHAVMQLNAEDGGNRRFIMVQLPEETEEGSEARKAGYKNICEIGKERIRRAGKKVKEEAGLNGQDLDIGFRVFRVDDSNMQDVYFQPKAYSQDKLDLLFDNVKPDRNDLDLLFGAMLDWGVQLSLPMATKKVKSEKLKVEIPVYVVNEGDLVACFSENISDEVIDFIAEQSPLRVLLRDSCFSSDSDKINIFEQLKQRLGWSDEEAYKNVRVL